MSSADHLLHRVLKGFQGLIDIRIRMSHRGDAAHMGHQIDAAFTQAALHRGHGAFVDATNFLSPQLGDRAIRLRLRQDRDGMWMLRHRPRPQPDAAG